MSTTNAVEQFREIGVNTRVTGASPHTLVSMLFEGLLEKLATAKGLAERGDTSNRGAVISKAIAIVDSLRASLDMEKGGELSNNLLSLYDYMEIKLVEANSDASPQLVDEVSELVREIKSGWDAIEDQAGVPA